MKSEQLNILRKLIREEVSKIVKEEVYNQFPSLISEILKKPAIKSKLEENFSPIQNQKSIVKKSKISTGNKILDSILEETKPFDMSHQSGFDRVQMDGGFSMNEGFTVPQTSIIPTSDTVGNPIDPNSVPKEIIGALTKNYSSFMKKVEKSVGQRSNVQAFKTD